MEVGVGNAKLALALAAVLLAAGKTVSVKRKEVRRGRPARAARPEGFRNLPAARVARQPQNMHLLCSGGVPVACIRLARLPVAPCQPSPRLDPVCAGGQPGGALPHHRQRSQVQPLAAGAGRQRGRGGLLLALWEQGLHISLWIGDSLWGGKPTAPAHPRRAAASLLCRTCGNVAWQITASRLAASRALPPLAMQLEIDASLRAEGRGLKLDFQQLSGVLRLQQD